MPSRQSSSVAALVVFAICASHLTEARIYGKCSLARSLYQHGIPYNELADWICLAEGESSFNTEAINPSNTDGSVDWGLFQINDRYWCKPADGRLSANMCQVSCRLLLSTDIRYSLACAKTIRRMQGFSAWVAWNNRCRGIKPSVRHCFKGKLRQFG